MPLYIKDDGVAELVRTLAERRGVTKQEAVKQAVSAELARLDNAIPLWEKLKKLRESYGPLEPTGLLADKAFFDELSGDL